jgi:ADP-ribosylation factor 2-binding protein
LLLSLGDFEAFKEVMLSYKNELNGGIQGFDIQCRGMKIYDQEQEDGDSRPDLDFGLQVAPVSRC